MKLKINKSASENPSWEPFNNPNAARLDGTLAQEIINENITVNDMAMTAGRSAIQASENNDVAETATTEANNIVVTANELTSSANEIINTYQGAIEEVVDASSKSKEVASSSLVLINEDKSYIDIVEGNKERAYKAANAAKSNANSGKNNAAFGRTSMTNNANSINIANQKANSFSARGQLVTEEVAALSPQIAPIALLAESYEDRILAEEEKVTIFDAADVSVKSDVLELAEDEVDSIALYIEKINALFV